MRKAPGAAHRAARPSREVGCAASGASFSRARALSFDASCAWLEGFRGGRVRARPDCGRRTPWRVARWRSSGPPRRRPTPRTGPAAAPPRVAPGLPPQGSPRPSRAEGRSRPGPHRAGAGRRRSRTRRHSGPAGAPTAREPGVQPGVRAGAIAASPPRRWSGRGGSRPVRRRHPGASRAAWRALGTTRPVRRELPWRRPRTRGPGMRGRRAASGRIRAVSPHECPCSKCIVGSNWSSRARSAAARRSASSLRGPAGRRHLCRLLDGRSGSTERPTG